MPYVKNKFHRLHQSFSQSHNRSNTSKGESLALNQLKCDPNMVCKEADKGGALVVMDTDYYKTAMQTKLKDTSTYKESNQTVEEILYRKSQ